MVKYYLKESCSLKIGSWRFDFFIFLSHFGKFLKNIAGMLKGIKPGRKVEKGPASCQEGIKRDHGIQPRALSGC